MSFQNCDRANTGIRRANGYTPVMGSLLNLGNYIVAALLLAVGFSLPLNAQTARLDTLHAELLEAGPEQAAYLGERIADEWAKSGSASMDLLLRRGRDAVEAGEFIAAIEHFTALVDHAPDFAEGYNSRAAAYYLAGYTGPALDDLRQALVLNPRHFAALRGFGVILEELERYAEALEVFGQVLAIYPYAEGVVEAEKRLRERLTGETL